MSFVERVLEHPWGYGLYCLLPAAFSPFSLGMIDAIKPPSIGELPPHTTLVFNTAICVYMVYNYDQALVGMSEQQSSD